MRASMIPSSRPLMTCPRTARAVPRGARCAANGTTICATTEVKPSSTEKTRKIGRCGAIAASPAAPPSRPEPVDARARFSIRSPRGISTMIPAA